METTGAEALSDAELLAILLGTGTEAETAVGLAQRLLAEGERIEGAGLRFLATAGTAEMARMRGIGLAKAARIRAAVELGRRIARASAQRPAVRRPHDVADLLMASMRHLEQEQFRVVLLNTKNLVLGIELVSVGSLNASIAHPREIFKLAVRRNANALILAHNHPSGDPTPSSEDIEVTRRMIDAGRVLGIEVLDHLVIGDGRFSSLRELGLGWQ